MTHSLDGNCGTNAPWPRRGAQSTGTRDGATVLVLVSVHHPRRAARRLPQPTHRANISVVYVSTVDGQKQVGSGGKARVARGEG